MWGKNGKEWRLPGKQVPGGRRLSWVTLVRREVVAQGIMGWNRSKRLGYLQDLRPGRLEWGKAHLKSRGIREYQKQANVINRAITSHRFISEKKMRQYESTRGEIAQANQEFSAWRAIHDRKSWEYQFDHGLDRGQPAPRIGAGDLGFFMNIDHRPRRRKSWKKLPNTSAN